MGKDAVEEWVRMWKGRKEEVGGGGGGGGEGEGEGGGRRRKGEGLGVLCRLLGMDRKGKDVTREEVVEWVVRRMRQEMKADGEGRVVKGTLMAEWKGCHARMFGVAGEERPVDEQGNPLQCAVM